MADVSIQTDDGKVALVHIPATIDTPEVLLVQIVWGGQDITITDTPISRRVPEPIRRLAEQLIAEVISFKEIDHGGK
jgi:hypothetical protein